MFYILIWVMLLEFLAILFFIILALVENFYLTSKKNKEEIDCKILSQFLIECLKKKQLPLQFLSGKLKNPYQLLKVLEDFNLRFQGGFWLKIKEELSCQFLLPLARKKVASRFWTRRHFAARCFALFPLEEDRPFILLLIKDSVFLVLSVAALAAIRLENPEGILIMLQKLSLEKNNYLSSFYKDLILQGSTQVFKCIEKQALEKVDKNIHLTCLDILGAKVFPVNQMLLQQDLISDDPKIRHAALKIYAHNPQKDSESVLLNAIRSFEPENRFEAAYGLAIYPSEGSLMALKEALNDSYMPVRLQAAKSLKKMGLKGIEILKQQKDQGDHLSEELVNFVLGFS